ncbi:MAG: response regulator, partial [Spirochaetes bacterium]|nr:response regulator [Spirochaetota bacterium]
TIMRDENEKEGGRLHFEVEEIIPDDFFLKQFTDADPLKRYAAITVSDTGVGIDEETQKHIFEPFFTTKTKDEGTGLGMAMVYSIVNKHAGFITIKSDVGTGTTITIYLPLIEGKEEYIKESEHKETIRFGSGKILVIDDEQFMLSIADEMLRLCGYESITFDNGREALDWYLKEKDSVDAVLLDMAMPEMSGLEVYEELLKINEDIKVLLTSGFPQNKNVQRIMNMGANGFIQKPYSAFKLSEKLHFIFEDKKE